MSEKCDVCGGRITYGRLERLKDAEGHLVEFREVHCSNKKCIINGATLYL